MRKTISLVAGGLLLAALGGCAHESASSAASAVSTSTADLANQVVLKSTTALSLGELAFTTAEQGATAALKSPSFTAAQKSVIGQKVKLARGYRDQARTLVKNGQDASATLVLLSNAVTDIATATAAAKGN